MSTPEETRPDASATAGAPAAQGAQGAPVRRRPSRSEVRRALLDAAAEQFALRGIEGASLDDVAAAAGYTKGAVYSSFGSKRALVDALVEDRTTAYLDAGLAAVDVEGLDLVDKARALGDGLTATGRSQGDWHLLLVELWQRAVRDHDPHGAFVTYREQLRSEVARAVAAHADEAGSELALSPDDLATVVMALTTGLAMEHLVAPDHVPDRLLGDVLSILAGPRRT